MNILVTGGAGYIGSHTIVELLNTNHEVIVIDNLVNSSLESLRRVEEITNKPVYFYEKDLRDRDALDSIFLKHNIDAVIHFAGLKAVGESTKKPLLYYETNLNSTIVLLESMRKHKVNKLVFSSSATVYGNAPSPYKETSTTGQGITNPYGETKYMIERMLSDVCSSDPTVGFTSLRYFNPIGAHSSGKIGEDPRDTPNNLMPYLTQVAVKQRNELGVFGDDYETIDGTGVRDYIHVVDLAKGHVAALSHNKPGHFVVNLGSGKGVSVLELISAFERATGINIPYKILPRRNGDLAESCADTSLAYSTLGWKTELSLEDACRDAWRWQSTNPQGYTPKKEV